MCLPTLSTYQSSRHLHPLAHSLSMFDLVFVVSLWRCVHHCYPMKRICVQRYRIKTSKLLQLDWTSCTDAHKNHFRRDREGYDGFEATHEKLSSRRIHWCGEQFCIFWMCLVESSNAEVSGASKVPQSRGKLIF